MSRWIPTVAFVALAVHGVACGGDDESDEARIPCDDLTCAATEYCAAQCVGSGQPPPGGGTVPATTEYSCRPIPDGCSADDLCSCTALPTTLLCEEATRTVNIPCY